MVPQDVTERLLVEDLQRKGGQVEYENENPEIHKIFEDDLKQHGVTCTMENMSPFCTAAVAA